jgi:hypothetical protein
MSRRPFTEEVRFSTDATRELKIFAGTWIVLTLAGLSLANGSIDISKARSIIDVSISNADGGVEEGSRD